MNQPIRMRETVNIVELVMDILKRWRVLVFIMGGFIALGILYIMIATPTYRAEITLIPQQRSNPAGGLSDLASLAGFDLNSAPSNEELYRDILISDRLLDSLATVKWRTQRFPTGRTLQELLGIDHDSDHPDPTAFQRYQLKDELRRNAIRFSTFENGLMQLSVTLPGDPEIPSQVATWLITQLDRFNERFRKTQAQQNMRQIERQMIDSKNDLYRAEALLKDFVESNQQYQSSPELSLRYGRLQREIITVNTIYTELRKQYELARISAEKDEETLVILDQASPSLETYSPKPLLILASMCIFGVVAGAVFLSIRFLFNIT